MKIPVGYIFTPVYKIKAGDVLHIHGEVLDVYETASRSFYDAETDQNYFASNICLVFESYEQGEFLFKDFSHTEYLRVLKYAKVPSESVKQKNIFRHLQVRTVDHLNLP